LEVLNKLNKHSESFWKKNSKLDTSRSLFTTYLDSNSTCLTQVPGWSDPLLMVNHIRVEIRVGKMKVNCALSIWKLRVENLTIFVEPQAVCCSHELQV